jgi:putative flavoprotein involved in K+ transport
MKSLFREIGALTKNPVPMSHIGRNRKKRTWTSRMSIEKVETLIIGGGQAGLAMSAHLRKRGAPHLIVERGRIAERWRTERWDSLVANGPAWHDRFPDQTFADTEPDGFPEAAKVVDYFVQFADAIEAPIRCGVEVEALHKKEGGSGFRVETSAGVIEAENVVAATGPFQRPLIPTVVPADSGIVQLHSNSYRNPARLPEGAVLVVGAGSSGVQIADELRRAGRRVYLSVGPHDRPPRRYRGHDYCWWLGVLGKWDVKTPSPSMQHVTIAVSGAFGGHTVDFRRLASSGIILVGMAQTFENGVMHFAPDLAENIRQGDANYLSTLDEADAYARQKGLDLPEEPEARKLDPDPHCMIEPIRHLDLAQAGVTSILWATGYSLDFGWLKVDAFDAKGSPRHERGVSVVPGLYFLGLPWLSRRGSSFIWGVWHDAAYLAEHIATHRAGELIVAAAS